MLYATEAAALARAQELSSSFHGTLFTAALTAEGRPTVVNGSLHYSCPGYRKLAAFMNGKRLA